jgi:arsenite-transporting ATPase
MPILKAKFYKREIVGFELLTILGNDIYGGKDPTKAFYKEKPMEIKKVGKKQYTLRLKLPFLKKGEIDLKQIGDELVIKVGWFKRNIVLPDTLVGLGIKGARFEQEDLIIKFG